MPRRNKSAKHTRLRVVDHEANKTRYPSRQAAEKAAELRMLENMSLELGVYQGDDGGWYLTRQIKDS